MSPQEAYEALKDILAVCVDTRLSLRMLPSSPWTLFVPASSLGYVEWWHPVVWAPRMRGLSHRRLMVGEFVNMRLKIAGGDIVNAIGAGQYVRDRYVNGQVLIERRPMRGP
jgi:hypothetical protein